MIKNNYKINIIVCGAAFFFSIVNAGYSAYNTTSGGYRSGRVHHFRPRPTVTQQPVTTVTQQPVVTTTVSPTTTVTTNPITKNPVTTTTTVTGQPSSTTKQPPHKPTPPAQQKPIIPSQKPEGPKEPIAVDPFATVHTMDLVLNQAANTAQRNNTTIAQELDPYLKSDMFDNPTMLAGLAQDLQKAGYKQSLNELLKTTGNSTTFIDTAGTSFVLDSNNVYTLNKEISLYNQTPGQSIQLLSANLHLFPPNISRYDTSLSEPVARATAMGKIIAHQQNQFDLIVVQEAWDANARDAFYNQIQKIYPYKIEDNYQSYMEVIQKDVILGSGLAVYSQYPFEMLMTPAGKKQNYVLEVFSDDRTDKVFAYKGFLIVKIIKNGVPVYVINTHLESGERDWDNYLPEVKKEDPAITQELELHEMEQIKFALQFVIMHDYYATQLQNIYKSCKTEKGWFAEFFNQYVFNFGKKNPSKSVNLTANDQKEIECVMQKIDDFVKTTANFWQQAYLFMAGSFNMKNLSLFGLTTLPDLLNNKFKNTQSTQTDLDHIVSIGKKLALYTDGREVGGAYVSDLFARNHTDRLALGFFGKMVS